MAKTDDELAQLEHKAAEAEAKARAARAKAAQVQAARTAAQVARERAWDEAALARYDEEQAELEKAEAKALEAFRAAVRADPVHRAWLEYRRLRGIRVRRVSEAQSIVNRWGLPPRYFSPVGPGVEDMANQAHQVIDRAVGNAVEDVDEARWAERTAETE